jgi:hypothetical protein
MAPPERLDSILTEMRIYGHPTYWSSTPTVCLSESDSRGVASLLKHGWAPWGIVLARQWVWDQGGGPVWYVRNDRYQKVQAALDEDARTWLVRTEPDTSDWMHEREWRIPTSPDADYVDLSLDDGPVAVLVADRDWGPQHVHTMDISPYTGDIAQVLQVPAEHRLPRWFWNGSEIEVLEPVPDGTIYLDG